MSSSRISVYAVSPRTRGKTVYLRSAAGVWTVVSPLDDYWIEFYALPRDHEGILHEAEACGIFQKTRSQPQRLPPNEHAYGFRQRSMECCFFIAERDGYGRSYGCLQMRIMKLRSRALFRRSGRL
jgi:hypothetical protein